MNIFSKIIAFLAVLLVIIFGVKIFFFKGKPNIVPKNVNVIEKLREAGQKKGIDFALIEINQDFDLVATHQGVRLIFSTDGNFDKKINSLQKVLKSTKMGENIKEIDFRFNKIVLRYK
jgi:hypothetical protein